MIRQLKKGILRNWERRIKKWSLSFRSRDRKVPSSILLPCKNSFRITKNITLKLWRNNSKMIMISFFPRPIESTITPEIFRAIGEPIDSRILEHHWKISKRKSKNLSNSFKIDLKVLRLSRPRKTRTSSKAIMKLSTIIDLAPVSRRDFSSEKVHLPTILSIVKTRKENLW